MKIGPILIILGFMIGTFFLLKTNLMGAIISVVAILVCLVIEKKK